MRRRGAVLLVVAALCAVGCGARFKDTGSTNANAGLGGGTSQQLQTSGPGDSSLVPGAGGSGTASTIAGATATTLAAAAASVDPGSTSGVTATAIKVGYLLPITGAAPVPQSFAKGGNAYYADLNAKGGINGRK